MDIPSSDSNKSPALNQIVDLYLVHARGTNHQLVYHNIQQVFNRAEEIVATVSEPEPRPVLAPAPHRVSSEQENAICAAYEAGSLREVVAQCDVSKHCVENCLRRQGVATRRHQTSTAPGP